MPECGTRTYVEDNKYLRWNAGDEITVFAGNSYNGHWQFAGDDGANSGKFNEVEEGGFVTGTPLDLTANYAIYYERQKLWEAKGNVVVIRRDREEGDTTVTGLTEVYTQQLFWDARTKKVYSNVDTKVLQPDGWHFGVGFEADEDLKNIHFRKYKSEMEFDFSPVEESPEDKKSDKTSDAKQGGDKRGDRPKPGGRPAPRESKRPGVNPSMSTNPTVGKTPSAAKSPQVPQSPARQRPNVGAQSLSTQMSVGGVPSKNTGSVERSGSPAKRAGEQRMESSPKSAGARSATAKPVAGAKSSSTQTKM
jgi:hypothetical protein